MFLVKARGELDYLKGLNLVPNVMLQGWCGQGIVVNEAWLWARTQILGQFRFLKNAVHTAKLS